MPVPFDRDWKHLSGLRLADPEFGTPGHVDILLGVDVFNRVVRQGRRQGPPGSPMAMNTKFGWVYQERSVVIAPDIEKWRVCHQYSKATRY